jgi:hypothetical protein
MGCGEFKSKTEIPVRRCYCVPVREESGQAQKDSRGDAWVVLCLPQISYVEVLTPSTSQCNLILK